MERKIRPALVLLSGRYMRERASLRLFTSLSLLFLCSTPILKMFCIKNYMSVRKHMENLLYEHGLFLLFKASPREEGH